MRGKITSEEAEVNRSDFRGGVASSGVSEDDTFGGRCLQGTEEREYKRTRTKWFFARNEDVVRNKMLAGPEQGQSRLPSRASQNPERHKIPGSNIKAKIHEVCRPPIQSSVAEEVEQTAAAYNKKHVCFLTSVDCCCSKLKFK
ncbi:unnamed protein product [Lactuca saligna]|uniref:Uncharacterized protein n=1 Tax=Lactuca saligna TaxID=75948 RepID=A0AA35YMF4_LACSI|nr:unnamed protein product [Lactuca saligna]